MGSRGREKEASLAIGLQTELSSRASKPSPHILLRPSRSESASQCTEWHVLLLLLLLLLLHLPVAPPPHHLPSVLLDNYNCSYRHQVPFPSPHFLPNTLPLPNSLLSISIPILPLPNSLTNSLSIPLLWIPHPPTLQLLTRPNPSPNFPHNPILYSRIESFRSRPASSHYRLQSATTFADTNVHSSDHVETQVPKDIRAHPQVCSLKTLLRPSSEEERRGAGRR